MAERGTGDLEKLTQRVARRALDVNNTDFAWMAALYGHGITTSENGKS